MSPERAAAPGSNTEGSGQADQAGDSIKGQRTRRRPPRVVDGLGVGARVVRPCSTCGAPGVLDLGTSGLCTTHASERLRSFDPAVWSMNGRWLQSGRLRPDFGPGFADCECPACGATAVALVGSACGYCDLARERLAGWQAALTLAPPEIDRDDRRRAGVLRGWAERLAVAVEAGIVTDDEARRAWAPEVADRVAA